MATDMQSMPFIKHLASSGMSCDPQKIFLAGREDSADIPSHEDHHQVVALGLGDTRTSTRELG